MSTNYNIERNSFLYGELNTLVKKNNYSGLETATTVTHVDNASNTIYVDAKIDIETLEKDIEKVEQSYEEFKIEKKLIEATFEQAKLQMSEIIEDNKQTRKRVADVEKSLIDLDEKVTKELEATIAQVKSDISKVKKEVEDDIQPKLELLYSEISKLKIDVETIISEEITKLKAEIQDIINTKQDKLISGVNIKTINGEPIIGEGDVRITSGEWGKITGDISDLTDLSVQLASKANTVYVNNKIDEEKQHSDGKCDYLYYDLFGIIDPDVKEVWYLMSSDKINPIAGPYELGSGGGGGGSVTEMTLEEVKIPKSISSTATTCPVTFKWTSTKGTNKNPTGNGTAFFFLGNDLMKTSPNISQGTVTIDIIDVIKNSSLSSNEITLKVVDAYNNFLQLKFTITTIAIELKSNFVTDAPFSITVNYTCIPVGKVSKDIYFYVDGEYYDKIEKWEKSGELLTHPIYINEHGSHTVLVYFVCDVDGEEVKSNELYYDLMVVIEGDNTPIITSTFNKLEQEQYVAFTIPYRVYTPGKNESDIELLVNDEVVSTLRVNQDMQYWEYRSINPGEFVLHIKCQDTVKEFNITVKESEILVDPVTENLALYLNATGRSNSESPEDRRKWEYRYITATGEEKVISADLLHFNFSSDGWIKDEAGNTVLKVAGDARVTIPYKIFEKDFRTTGKTIEVEFSTESVMDYDSKIISCVSTSSGKEIGLKITALEAIYTSALSEVSSQYKEEDHIRIAFTIDKINERRLLLMYVDGILCGGMKYPESDSFNQPIPVDISIGSNGATTNIYCIRVYDNNLTMQLIVNNWIADTQSGELKRNRYVRNDNFNSSGDIVMDKLPSNLPYIIWDIDPLPQFKGDKRKGLAYYKDPNNSDKNFHLPVVDGEPQGEYNVQGTSSAAYPVKNIRLKSKLGFINDEGETNPLFYITDNGIGANYFTYKVDFASSEGANNVELTKLYNDVSKELGILTPPQKLDSRVRVGIDGFPIVAFHRNSSRLDSFSTKANFNNDKANEDVYGFVDGDESWEITNNSADEANFKLPATPETFSKAFEIRFPDLDGYSDLTKLQPMTEWVVSTNPETATGNALATPISYKYTNVVRAEDGTYSRVEVTTPEYTHDTLEYRLSKFKAELPNWFDVNSTIFYYIFTHLFLMIDSRAKNAFPTYYVSRQPGDGGNRWFWLPYDMDTAIGIDNEGKLKFNYNLEDTDKVPGSDADVYNGQQSVMWNNLRKMFDGEIGQMYSELRATGKLLSFDNTEARFEAHQNKWSENIFNRDSEIKYIDTLTDSDNYLEMMQGNKASQRKWWLYNRFRYFDSKYLAGDAKSDILQFRAYGKADITVIPYADVYVTVSYANSADANVSVRAEKDKAYTLKNPLPSSASDQETYIYSASQLKSVGDLSPFKPDTVKAGAATRLQSLKLGSNLAGYTNPNLKELTLGNNKLLKSLDVRNCTNLKQVIDLSNCTGIEEIYCEGTQIGGVTLPTAGGLKIMHLPGTITSLIIRNQPALYDLSIQDKEQMSLTKLWMENVSGSVYNVYDLIRGMEAGYNIRLIGINESVRAVSEITTLYNLFDRMKGLDARGEQVDKAQVNGIIHIPEISYTDYKNLTARYPDITIDAIVISCKVRFFNEGEQYGMTQTVYSGYPASKPVPDPTKPSSEEFDYIFTGWDKDFSVVTEDMDINAVYEARERIYEIKFDTRTPLVTIPSQKLKYKEYVTRPHDPSVPDAIFRGWYTEPNCINLYNFSEPVEYAFTLYAKWEDLNVPQISISKESYNTFIYDISDNLAINAYAITMSSTEPKSDLWIIIDPPQTPYTGTYTVLSAGTYYVWAKDIAGHIVNNYVTAYNVAISAAKGTEITILSGEDSVNNCALEGTVIKVNSVLDPHYESYVLYYNDKEIQSGFVDVLKEDVFVRTTSIAKYFTVQFDNGKHGEKPEDLIVQYGTTATQPENQFVDQRIIEGWYTSPTFEQSYYWDFANNVVLKNMILYANWIVYTEPDLLEVTIVDENTAVKLNFTLTESNGVEVNWGDSAVIETDDRVNTITLSHTYTSPGKYIITTRCLKGSHQLGIGSFDHPTIEPAYLLTNIEFALNMPMTTLYAFVNCTGLTKVTIPKYMTDLALGMFRGCSNISVLNLPKELKAIQAQALYGCKSLTGVLSLPESLTGIGDSAFYGCTGLEGVDIPESVIALGTSAFSGCTSITAFSIPRQITLLPSGLLQSCESLLEVIVPISVEKLGDNVFNGCTSLRKIILMNENLISGSYCFTGCMNLKTMGPLGGGYDIEYAWKERIPNNIFEAATTSASALELVVLVDTIKSIGGSAFARTAIININLPVGLKEIGTAAFFDCTRLTNLEIPATVENIGTNAFYRCLSLNILSIPFVENGITIEARAFELCTGLSRADIHALYSLFKVNTYIDSWFLNCSTSLKLHIPRVITNPNSAYGSSWNFVADGVTLSYEADLD